MDVQMSNVVSDLWADYITQFDHVHEATPISDITKIKLNLVIRTATSFMLNWMTQSSQSWWQKVEGNM
jgi:hypothetical protein